VYADPVVVNGTEMTITELAGRARSLQQAFDRLGPFRRGNGASTRLS
jgi:hypothetical protein